MEATLQEVRDWAEEMERVRAALVLERGEFPGPSALCKSFHWAPMRIWREVLRLSSELLDHSGHGAIDATYFDRQQASSHYLKRCDREVQTIETTFLVDTAHSAVIDVHCSAKWPNGTKIGPQVALRNVADSWGLARRAARAIHAARVIMSTNASKGHHQRRRPPLSGVAQSTN